MTERELARLTELCGPVSRETFARLKVFQASLLRWNARINLIASSTEAELWERHIIDSAQLLPLVPDAVKWLDFGSGGGLPALVVAILLQGREGVQITLVESNRKKAAFLQSMVGELDLPAEVIPRRVESVPVSSLDVVTARAVSQLSTLIDLSAPWLLAGAKGLFQKGRDYQEEVSEALSEWSFDLLVHPSAVGTDGVILEIVNLRRSDTSPF